MAKKGNHGFAKGTKKSAKGGLIVTPAPTPTKK